MPYTVERGEEPPGTLLRCRDIQRWLGLSNWSFYQAVKAGLLPSKRLIPGGVPYYRKEDVVCVFLEGFKPTALPPKEVVTKPPRRVRGPRGFVEGKKHDDAAQ